MSRQTIDGAVYAKMLWGGAARLAEHASTINDLNVFPVADGDTGTNMKKTMEGGLNAVRGREERHLGRCSDAFARGVLLSARGNSGVILSQIFAGINEELSQWESADALRLARAYRLGIERSYASVQNPTEGTILTVFRESAEYAGEHIDEGSAVEDFFRLHVEEARRSLASTKELLPALAEADVIDSGAAGYLCIAQGMYEVLTGRIETDAQRIFAQEPRETEMPDIARFTRDSKLELGYCTEFLLRLTTEKCDPDRWEIGVMLDGLRALGGESVVAYKQDDIVKVHVHTLRPGEVLAFAQRFGEFLTVKVENMSLGHSESAPKPKPKKPSKPYSVLAVASGDGLCALLGEMGVDRIIAGGQTDNPSIEEFVEAFEACDSEHILVFPNNKNVILAARQASELYQAAAIHIVPTKSLMQGYAALSVLTPGITDIDALVRSAERAAEGVTDIEVTRAVRDVTLDGRRIRTGEFIAISRGAVIAVAENAEAAALRALASSETELCEIVTLFAGEGVSHESRATLVEKLRAEYPDCEIVAYEGGQAVYDYMIAIE